MTFGSCARKEPDFLELEDSKRVSWTVQYGRVTKPISSPAKQKKLRRSKEIELSKEFLEGLKRQKDKRPRCFVKPTMAWKVKRYRLSKGDSLIPEDAQSPKPICLFSCPRRPNVYEMRKTSWGFCNPHESHSRTERGKGPAFSRRHRRTSKRIALFRCYTEQEHPLWYFRFIGIHSKSVF